MAIAEPPQPALSEAAATASPRALFLNHKWRISLTYGLFCLENLLRLAQPFVLGLAINGLLHNSPAGLVLFVVQHLAHMAVSSFRRMYDTRVFMGIYANLATGLVVGQRRQNVEVSRVAAHSSMSQQVVEFLEHYVPLLIRSGFSILGALAMLVFYDPLLVLICLALALPAAVINYVYARRTLHYSGRLHDELERQVDAIQQAEPAEVRGHYAAVRRWRVKLSDCEAINFGLMELFILAVMAVSLLRVCSLPAVEPGDIFAVFRYVLMMIMGLDALPKLVQQVSRILDIRRRIRGRRSEKGFEN